MNTLDENNVAAFTSDIHDKILRISFTFFYLKNYLRKLIVTLKLPRLLHLKCVFKYMKIKLQIN